MSQDSSQADPNPAGSGELGASYRRILDIIGEGVVIADAAGVITFVNPRFARIFGVTEQDLVGRKVTDFLDGESRERWLGMREARGLGQSSRYELQLKNREGSLVDCMVTGAPIMTAEGAFAGSIGTLADITALKAATRTLEDRNRTLQVLVAYDELISGAITSPPVETTLQFIRDRIGYAECAVGILNAEEDGFALKMLPGSARSSEAEARFVPADETVFTELVQEPLARYRPDLMAEPTTYAADHWLVRAGCRSEHLVPLWAENRCLGVLSVAAEARDGIPEEDRRILSLLSPRLAQALHNAELFFSLQESEEQYRRLVEGSPDVVYSYSDRRGGLYYSPKVKAVLGHSAGYLYDHPHLWNESIHPDDAARIAEVIDKLKLGESFEVEYRIRDSEGNYRWLRDRSVGISLQQDETIVNGIATDITEQRKLEQELLQAQKMEAVGQLAGGIAHDFNNVLAVILGHAELLKGGVPPDSEAGKDIELILSAAARGAALTRKILAFSRKQVMDMRVVGLNGMIRDLKKMVLHLIGEDIAIRTIIPKDDIHVQADPVQLEQVLVNLATNARDAMPRGGTITIECSVEELGAGFIRRHGYGEPGSFALLSMTDTGVGMDQALQDRIMEPFFTTKEVGKGTGLGLSSAYGIIKQHGGYLGIESEPGSGTTVKIHLPRVDRPDQEPHEDGRQPARVTGSETILVGEDDEAVLDLWRTVLQDNGYTVIAARDGAEALELFRRNRDRVDLLLLDMIMPNKSGSEVCAAAQELKPDIRTLFVSGYSANLVLEKSVPCRQSQIVYKPISIHALLTRIREVLDDRSG